MIREERHMCVSMSRVLWPRLLQPVMRRHPLSCSHLMVRNTSREIGYYRPVKRVKPEPLASNISRVMRARDEQLSRPLDPFSRVVDPDLLDSMIPETGNSFNVAAFVNRCPTLQQLVDLGVDLSIVEKDYEATNYLIRLDFGRHVRDHIQALVDVGVRPRDLGHFITHNPMIFAVSIHNIRARVEYLLSKRFPKSAVSQILTLFPPYLSLSVKEVDARLGFVQQEFGLKPSQVRCVLVHHPQILEPEDPIPFRVINFSLTDVMGFTRDQARTIVTQVPAILSRPHQHLVNVFDLLHNTGHVDHEVILLFPEVLLAEEGQLRQRIDYLMLLGRAQFVPTAPLFVPLSALSVAGDAVFATKYARTSEDDYNLFLKDR